VQAGEVDILILPEMASRCTTISCAENDQRGLFEEEEEDIFAMKFGADFISSHSF